MPKPRNHAIYVQDMRDAVERIATYVAGYDLEQFKADRKTVDAVLRNFEILGEASGRIPPEMRALAPEINWRGMKDFRNVVAHFYSGIDLDVVWALIAERLPELDTSIRKLQERLSQPEG